MQKFIKSFRIKYFPHLRNKYSITLVGFILWLGFFDRNDFLTTWNYHKKLNELRIEKAYYESEILKDRTYLNELQSNTGNLEKYAREKYYMKRDNEDIFVIVDKRKKEKPEQELN